MAGALAEEVMRGFEGWGVGKREWRSVRFSLLLKEVAGRAVNGVAVGTPVCRSIFLGIG